MITFGERLRELRKDKKLSQRELGEIFGLSESTIGMYERGQRFPDFDILVKFADFFDTTTDYLLTGRKPEKELPELNEKDKKDIAKQLETILQRMDSDTALAFFDGEPLDEETKELVKEAIKSNLELTKKLAKAKFTPKKYRK